MKKLYLILLSLAMCANLASCQNASDSSDKPESTAANTTIVATTTTPATDTPDAPNTEPSIVKHTMGETVSTNIVDFTLVNSTFTYYASNVSTDYGAPTDKPNTLFSAKTGTCYVSMTVTIQNKDRAGSLDFCGKWNPGKWTVNYNGETYPIYGFDLNIAKYPNVKLNYGGAFVEPDTGKVLSKVGTGNKLISAGEEYTIRFFGIIHADPASLDDSFELTVKVPNSTGEYEDFVYTVSK